MFQIDYLKLLQDVGIKDAITTSLKNKSGLSEQKIEKLYTERILHHGQKMQKFMNEYVEKYLDLKKDNNTDIDQQLDAMVAAFIADTRQKDQ
jgi:predicted RNase H-like nuclease